MMRLSAVQRFPLIAELAAQSATRQLLRYAIGGFAVTQFAASIYAALVLFAKLVPLQANVASTGCGLLAGYLVHSRWSFAGGGATNEYGKVGRFLLSSAIAFAINSFWVWLLVSFYHLPPLAPIPLMMVATPGLSFLLNRYWVFQAA